MIRIVRKPAGACLAAALCLAGCGQSGPKTVPVYGTVTFAGREKVPQICRLYFHPLETEGVSRPTVATAEPDGSYETRAFKNSKGLIPGTYRVKVSYFDVKPGADPKVETNWIESKYDAGELVVDADARGVEHDIQVPAQ